LDKRIREIPSILRICGLIDQFCSSRFWYIFVIIRAMFAAVATAKTSLKMVFFGHYEKAVFVIIKVFPFN